MSPIEGGFEIALSGDTARVLALSTTEGKSKKATFGEKAACSLKVVAGARNRLDLLLTATAMSP